MKAFRTIFFVDDDVDDQEIFSIALAEIDDSIQCVTASNGFEAIQKLSGNQVIPDCIFLDLNMPRMGGKQFLQTIKSAPGINKIPVVIFTTSAEPRDVNETLALGASEFITKPSGINELVSTLKSVFVKLSSQ